MAPSENQQIQPLGASQQGDAPRAREEPTPPQPLSDPRVYYQHPQIVPGAKPGRDDLVSPVDDDTDSVEWTVLIENESGHHCIDDLERLSRATSMDLRRWRTQHSLAVHDFALAKLDFNICAITTLDDEENFLSKLRCWAVSELYAASIVLRAKTGDNTMTPELGYVMSTIANLDTWNELQDQWLERRGAQTTSDGIGSPECGSKNSSELILGGLSGERI
ncbi:hypothetical protein NM208_g3349 [Fusarium decemcellulare]|uniref:Uncharacterized protein n=1 Tax=Fusarium decemcellulare TaxID=57161 RepID=A0ACC1SPE8_9HYPO|nr:hypothetical protein NM208_g3349 [Fusarium decemcellulare]